MPMKTRESSCNTATFIGNRSIRCLDLLGLDGKTIRDKFLIGDPQPCAIGNSGEMKRQGYVGIYDKNPSRFVMPRKLVFSYA